MGSNRAVDVASLSSFLICSEVRFWLGTACQHGACNDQI